MKKLGLTNSIKQTDYLYYKYDIIESYIPDNSTSGDNIYRCRNISY